MRKIIFTYKDDKTLSILISKENIKELLNSLDDNTTFFDEKTGSGFWTCKQEIRHIIIQEYVPELEEKAQKSEEKVEEDNKALLDRKEDLTDREIVATHA